MDFITAPRGKLIKLIYELAEENEALKTQLAELQERLGRKLGKDEEKSDKKQVPSLFSKDGVRTVGNATRRRLILPTVL